MERLEPRQVLDAMLTPALADTFDRAEQVEISEYNVLTGEQRILEPTETQEAIAELAVIDATASSLGFGGVDGLLEGLSGTEGMAGPELLFPRTVFGPDGRARITPTTSFPWQAIGQIVSTYSDGSWGRSSGAMISPFHLLTAAHCVRKSSDEGGTFASSVRIALGQDGEHWGSQTSATGLQSNNRYYGEANATYYRAYSWSNTDWDYDIALLTLDRRIGNFTGSFGYGYDSNDSNFQNVSMNSDGYPADRNGGNFSTHYQFYAFDPITSVTTHQLRSDQLDATPGNSGGPLWKYVSSSGSRTIYGVDSHENSSYNSWTRITSDKYSWLQSSISTDNTSRPPTDRPDLVDWDAWFNDSDAYVSSSTARPGQSWTVTAYPRNNGTALAGSFTVSFYASTNTTISSSDYLLGSATISSLSAFSRATAMWSGTFPSGIPLGNYYVGWIIDSAGSQTEFLEGNNTGYIADTLLTVSDDNYEQNDARTSAYDLSTRERTWLSAVNGYGQQFDDDWYRIDVSPNEQRVQANLTLTHSAGDIDLQLVNGSGVVLAGSTGTGDIQSIDYVVSTSGTYYLRVYFANRGNRYDLWWDDVYHESTDWGDAPDPSYPTLLARNGARHTIVPGRFLGSRVDGEANGQPNATATGDNLAGVADDEDGVVFRTLLVPGLTATIDVAAAIPGKLDAWIDFDADGSWTEAGDRLFISSQPLVAGTNTLQFPVPSTAAASGTCFARFRFSSDGALSFDGLASNGEVEDYQVVVQPPVFQGTPNADTLTFSINGVTHTVTVNGVVTPLDATVISLIRFDGLGGNDQGTLTGAAGMNETLTARQNDIVLSDTAGTAYRVTVTNIKTVTVNAGAGGADTANIYDGPANDWFILYPTSADIRLDTSGTGGYVSRLLPNQFEAITGVATVWGTGGTDTATIYGTAGNDVFAGSKTGSNLTPAAGNPAVFNNTVQYFDTVQAYAMGGYDTATIDGGAGQDNLALRAPTAGPPAAVSRADMTYYSSGLPTPITTSLQDFDLMEANSTDTGIDLVNFYDSSGNDTYVGQAGAAGVANRQARLYDSDGPGVGFDYDLRANGFGYVYVLAGTGTGGTDTATLTGSAAGTDRYTATTGGSALRYANNDLQSLNVFEEITVNGNGGTDYAVLYDTTGNDRYDVTLTQARLQKLSGPGNAYDHTLNGFTWAYAYGTAGGFDEAYFTDGAGNDRMTIGSGTTNDSTMTYSTGQFAYGRGFERVEATATPGVAVDQVWLYDTSANDVYTAMNGANEATMMPASGTAYSRRAVGFDKYYAYSIYGGTTDEAHLYDSPGNDVLQVGAGNPTRTKSPLETTLTYSTGPLAGMLLWNYAFEKVTAHATLASGDVDSALFYDDPNSSETFTADRNLARFRRNAGGWDINAMGFESVNAYGTPIPDPLNPITDIAEITDSAMNDTIWTFGADRRVFLFYGGSATNRILAETFDSVLAKVTTGGIDSIRMDDSANNDTFTSDDPATPGVDLDTAVMYDDLATYFYRIQGLSGGQVPGVGDSVLIRALYGFPPGGADREHHDAAIDYVFTKSGAWTSF